MNKDAFRLPEPCIVGCSGGRTSGYLLRRILDAYGGIKQPERVEVRTVEVPVLKDGQLKRVESLYTHMALLGEKLTNMAGSIRETIIPACPAPPRPVPIRPAIPPPKAVPPPRPIPRPNAVPPRPPVPPRRNPPSEPMPVGENGELRLSGTQRRVLNALAWYESLGNGRPSLVQVGAVALIDPKGGHFSNTVGPLSSHNLIDRDDGTISLTDAGRALAEVPESPGTLADYHEVLRKRVRKMKSASGRTVDMLNAIIAAGGRLSCEELGQAVNIDHEGGHFSNTIGPLSTAGLITRDSGIVSPTTVLFPSELN